MPTLTGRTGEFPTSPTSPTSKKRKLLSEADTAAARDEALQALLTARRVTEKVLSAILTGPS